MSFLLTVYVAVRALLRNKMRAALTVLGIVIGVGSVITMLAIGDGAKQAVMDRVSAMGSNLLLVLPALKYNLADDLDADLIGQSFFYGNKQSFEARQHRISLRLKWNF